LFPYFGSLRLVAVHEPAESAVQTGFVPVAGCLLPVAMLSVAVLMVAWLFVVANFPM
jgi:hypothetical protein